MLQFPHFDVAPVGLCGNGDEEHRETNHQPHDETLRIVLHQERVQAGVDVFHVGPLGGHLRFLELKNASVAAVHQGAFQQVFPLIRHAAQDVHGQFHHQVPAGGVEVGGGEHAVNHFLQACVRQGVHPKESHIVRGAQCFPRPQGHAVVLAEDGIGPDAARKHFLHGIVAAFPEPAAVRGRHQRDAGILLQGLREALVAVIGRGGALQPGNFHHPAFLVQEIGHVMPHDAADFHVVRPNEGGVFVGVDFPVEQNHRNAGVESFFHGRRNGVRLVGRDNKQVHAVRHKATDLRHLLLAVVVGGGKPECHPVHAGRQGQFCVQFAAPNIVTALRYAYNQ